MSASVGKTLMRAWLLIVAAVVNASFMPVEAHADPPGRLVYDIVVTAPGMRSQGWTVTLYDPAGDPIETEPGQPATTPLGEFVRVPCVDPWDSNVTCLYSADMVTTATGEPHSSQNLAVRPKFHPARRARCHAIASAIAM